MEEEEVVEVVAMGVVLVRKEVEEDLVVVLNLELVVEIDLE